MNIYVLMKRTFDTEEKIVIKNGAIYDGEAELSSTLTMNMRLKKQFK